MPTSSRKRAAKPDAPAVRVMLVDDHPIWRSTLRELLAHSVCEVIAEASDGTEALITARAQSPDVVVMDLSLPGISGIETTHTLRLDNPHVRVLVLSSSDEPTDVVEAVKAGASGYLVKTLGPEEVVDAILRVHRGELVFPASLSGVVLEEFRRLALEGPIPPPLRLAVADPVALARSGLAHILVEAGFLVTGAAASPDELIRLLEHDAADVAVVDARIASAKPDGRSTVMHRLRDAFPTLRVLVLSGEADASQAADIIEEGQSGVGYLLKERIADTTDLGNAIRRIAAGESIVDAQVVGRVIANGDGSDDRLRALTDREREVLALMAEGRSNQAIGETLFLGVKTVEAHVHHIFTKLGLDQSAGDHRRVLAVIAYLRSFSP